MNRILVALTTTPSDLFISVISELYEGDDAELEAAPHVERLQKEHPEWGEIAFYCIPIHPHDEKSYRADTLWEDIKDNQRTFGEVLAKQQEIICSVEKPQPPAPEPLDDEDGEEVEETHLP